MRIGWRTVDWNRSANGNDNGSAAPGGFDAEPGDDAPAPFAAAPFRQVTEPSGEQPYESAREPEAAQPDGESQPEASRRGSTVREPVFFGRESAPDNESAPVEPAAPQETSEGAEPAQIAPERPRRSGWWNRGR
jgi:hypothetical protein